MTENKSNETDALLEQNAYNLTDIQMIEGLCAYSFSKSDLTDDQKLMVTQVYQKSLVLKQLLIKDQQEQEQKRIDASLDPKDMTANKAKKESEESKSPKGKASTKSAKSDDENKEGSK